jgi:hypothetical protein
MILTIELLDLPLQFQILDNPMAKLWLERMNIRDLWPLDDPKRFYGFNSQEDEKRIALERIHKCINGINCWQPLIERTLESTADQDTLNYLHNIFEKWHGLLDARPTHPTYGVIPDHVREHLAMLNVSVHRCETAERGCQPRFVCTWYGMPKTRTLSADIIKEYGTLIPKFGTVCLNYAEIGKTLEDLAQDRDNYIGDDAFKPFNHYSADFVVRMYEESSAFVTEKVDRMQQYYNQHREFFVKQGLDNFKDPRLQPLRFPVAELIETMPRDQLLEEIRKRQDIVRVSIE